MQDKMLLQTEQKVVQMAIEETNTHISLLGLYTNNLYSALNAMQVQLDRIRNVPHEEVIRYEKIKEIRFDWKHQAEMIEQSFQREDTKNAGIGLAGVGVGVAVATMGPSLAMGFATTYGVASTGTAISALSGIAAKNAALAWLGGGTLAAGGGGMVAGETLLSLAGPVGWTIMGVSLLASGILFWKNNSDKKKIEDILVEICRRDCSFYGEAIEEIKKRIAAICKDRAKIYEAVDRIAGFGTDYNSMTEKQQYELLGYYHLMQGSTQLLVKPIKNLQPKYTKQDLDFYCKNAYNNGGIECLLYPNQVIALANFFYLFILEDSEKMLMYKTLKRNSSFLKSMGISEYQFDMNLLHTALAALDFKYYCMKIDGEL